jgi:hypothetical protein
MIHFWLIYYLFVLFVHTFGAAHANMGNSFTFDADALPDDKELSSSEIESIVGKKHFRQHEFDKIANSNGGTYMSGLQLKECIQDKLAMPPIRLIDLEDFRRHDSFPRHPNNKDMCVNLTEVNREESLIVFISHCWLRGWSGAEGWDAATCPHPDSSGHDKHKLCVSGITKLKDQLAPGMTKCYVWLDFGCMDQDGNPAGELKQLDEIVRCCDCIFTPIHGMAEMSDTIYDYYRDYKAAAWNAPLYGYTSRGWCRVEMFYAANIPLAIGSAHRLSKLRAALKFHTSRGVRPHLLYGTREELGSPIVLPPLQNFYFDLLNPIEGNVTMDADRAKIAELVALLTPYMQSVVVGYKGDMQEGKRHGRGVMTSADGAVYDGQWREGKQHGRGEMTHSNGNIYDGEWMEGKQHGWGVMTHAEGDVYNGEWVEGKHHGRGVMTYAGGDVYDGEWREGKRHGRGVLTSANGDVYDGQWDGEKHGRGVLTYANGDEYNGECAEGSMHGRGVYTYASGDVYDGEWARGKWHGRGVYISTVSGAVYDGEWVEGIVHGRGVMTYADGTVYDGQWMEGKQHGRGVLTYADGDVYDGECVEGRMYGRGVMTYAVGGMYDGQWVDGKMTHGVLQLDDGTSCDAVFSGGDDALDGARVYDVRLTVGGALYKEGKFSKGKLLLDASRPPSSSACVVS